MRSRRTGEKWAFPGGRSEAGESAHETATREAREEVGLDIELVGNLGRYLVPNPTGGFEITCFAATSTSDRLVLEDEILEARWCTLEEGKRLDLVSTARQALEAFDIAASDRSRTHGVRLR